MEKVFLIVDSVGWVSPFYFTSFSAASTRSEKLSSLRGYPCKVVKLEKSCFDE